MSIDEIRFCCKSMFKSPDCVVILLKIQESQSFMVIGFPVTRFKFKSTIKG